MLIIPVIDISQGVVVQATKSDRKSYKPIKSSISDNPDPESILTSYLKLYPFKIIYIADPVYYTHLTLPTNREV